MALSSDGPIDIQQIFLNFDTVGDKKIFVNQIGDILRVLDQTPIQKEIETLYMSKYTGEQRINFEEFFPIFVFCAERQPAKKILAETLIEGLKNFDRDGNGTLTQAEIRQFLSCRGDKLTDDEMRELFDGMGETNKIEDYVAKIMSSTL